MQLGLEGGRFARLQPGGERPVLVRFESEDLELALTDDAQGDALHPPRGEAAPDLVPEQRADLVSDQAVEDAAGLLCVHLINIDRLRPLEGLADRLLGDLVEHHAVEFRLGALGQLLFEMPADRLALAIGVGGEIDRLDALGRFLQLRQDLLLFGKNRICR